MIDPRLTADIRYAEDRKARRRARYHERKAAEPAFQARLITANLARRGSELGRRYNLAKRGVTPNQYAIWLAAQNGGCAICGAPEPTAGRTRFLQSITITHVAQPKTPPAENAPADFYVIDVTALLDY